MLAAQLCATQFELMLYKIQNDLRIEQLTTGFAKEGQKFYINFFYSSSDSSSFNMKNTYFLKQLQTQMAVQQKSKEVNMKNNDKVGTPKLLKHILMQILIHILIWLIHRSI